MSSEHKRYFIELLPEGGTVARSDENKMRREQAAHFIAAVNEWLSEQDLNSKVSTMAITALGQVHITCEDDVIGLIRSHEDEAIANIRAGTAFVGQMQRVGRLPA